MGALGAGGLVGEALGVLTCTAPDASADLRLQALQQRAAGHSRGGHGGEALADRWADAALWHGSWHAYGMGRTPFTRCMCGEGRV